MEMVRTIEQERSKFALECVKGVVKKESKLAKEYKSLVKKFPMMVLRNGLLQTVVFLDAKGKDQHKILLGHLKEYLISASPLRLKVGNKGLSEFLSSDVSVTEYRNITTDILAFAKWLGRYAEVLIEGEAEGE